jgi:TRAP-type C4-dicarboxylate transport system permease large subunit
LGVDLVHFGIVTTLNMMIGLSTPPFGMLLFITSSLSGTNLQKVVNEIWWPILAMIVVLILITFVPEIVLFLPKYFGFI